MPERPSPLRTSNTAAAPVPAADSGPTRALERRLGPLDAAAVIVSNVIGGGILFTPPQVAAAVPHAWMFLGVWAFGGLIAFAGAMAYAELAAVRPRAGGEYVYLRAAYGRLAAFLTGWTSFVAGFSGAVAASAVVLADYVGRFAPAAKDSTPIFTVPLPWVPLIFSKQALVALAAIALMSWIHLRGVGPGRLVGNVLASLKVSALLLFIALGLSFGAGSVSNLQQSGGAVSGTGLAPRLDTGDVHLLGVECRGVCGRRNTRSGPQRAAGARHRHGRGHRDLRAAQFSLPVRAAR